MIDSIGSGAAWLGVLVIPTMIGLILVWTIRDRKRAAGAKETLRKLREQQRDEGNE